MHAQIRRFRRSDRDQLTALINLHVQAVTPGMALSVNTVMSQLEREPGDQVIDPWVEERVALVAERDDVIVAAALLHRFSAEPEVPTGYRNGGQFRYLVCLPHELEAGERLIAAGLEQFDRWRSDRRSADGSFPTLGCVGVSNAWPHIESLYKTAGFVGPERTDVVLAAWCERLLGRELANTTTRRSVGALGTRIELLTNERVLGSIEVCQEHVGSIRTTSAARWADVGNFDLVTEVMSGEGFAASAVAGALFSEAAGWLLLGGVDRLIDYYAEDVHEPDHLDDLEDLGFVQLSRNGRGYRLVGT